METDLMCLAAGTMNRLINLSNKIADDNERLVNEIESQRELLHIKALTLKQLNENQLENIRQLSDLQLQISAEQLRRKNLMPEETQFYIDSLTKENKEKYDLYLEQIFYYKELYNINIELIKENRSIVITFLNNNQQISISLLNENKARVTYEENIDELIENCKYDLMETLVSRFNEIDILTKESLKELILSLNEIFL